MIQPVADGEILSCPVPKISDNGRSCPVLPIPLKALKHCDGQNRVYLYGYTTKMNTKRIKIQQVKKVFIKFIFERST